MVQAGVTVSVHGDDEWPTVRTDIMNLWRFVKTDAVNDDTLFQCTRGDHATWSCCGRHASLA